MKVWIHFTNCYILYIFQFKKNWGLNDRVNALFSTN